MDETNEARMIMGFVVRVQRGMAGWGWRIIDITDRELIADTYHSKGYYWMPTEEEAWSEAERWIRSDGMPL